jgi:hypothetical protein
VEDDFYIDENWLASYCEKDWFDHVRAQEIDCSHLFKFPVFSSSRLYCPYHETFADLVAASVTKASTIPERMIEVGSALGRTYYELCRRIPSLSEAVLVEPSRNLARTFSEIFDGAESCELPVLEGNTGTTKIGLRTTGIRKACSRVTRKLLNTPYANIPDEVLPSELVICSNVVDQCERPTALIELLKRKTISGGILALSCTYQWNRKYIRADEPLITNITDLFESGWRLIDEADIEFKCRRFERHWTTFLSHVCVLQKLSEQSAEAA